jgi:hypothetical protein
MVATGRASDRDDAIRLGNLLIMGNHIYPLEEDREFEDKRVFYR